MDGSIADSTVLRMRTQLQRMHHSSPTSQPDGFLEELLKMPAAPVADPVDDAQQAEPTLDATPTTAAAQTDKEKKNADKEPAANDEQVDNSLPTPCIPLCYGPAPIPVPQTAEPEVNVDAPVAVADPTVQTAVANEPVAQPVAVTETSPVVDNSDVAAVDAEVTADEFVPPVESNLQPLVKDNGSKSSRDVRRAKDARDKSEAPIERPQVVAKQPASTASDQTQAVAAKTTEDGPSADEGSHAVDASASAQSQDVNESKSARDDDRSQRDKWYEKSTTVNGDEPQASSADGVNDLLDDQSKSDAQVDLVRSESVTDVNATAVEASPLLTDASAQATLDNSQIASDMLATVQASAAQNASTQSVTESSGAASVDAARGRGTVPGSVVSAGAAGGARGSASAGSAAASSKESPDAPREITQQERVRLVQRVARSFSRLGPEGGQVTLKLHPPQLGVLNVSIKIEGQTMTARLQTETTAARDAIVENLPVLRDRLSEQGIEIEKFQVEVGQHEDMASGGGQSGNFAGNGENSPQSHSSAATEFDYRRAARGNASRQNAAPMIMEPKLQSWSAPGRSLDVRA